MKKVFKIGFWSILTLFGFVVLILLITTSFDTDISEETPSASVGKATLLPEKIPSTLVEKSLSLSEETSSTDLKQVASPSVEETMSNEINTSAEESDFFKELAEEKKRLQAEWNLPENANLKQLLKTIPVSETLEYITEPCKGYPGSNTVQYARKTLEVRQMPSMSRIQVEDMLLAEHEAGPNAYVRGYDSMVVEVQGRFSRATLDGDIEFEVWDKNQVFVVGTLLCTFPESQYNQIHSRQPNTFVRIKGRLCIIPIRGSKMVFYRLIYCSFVD